MGLIQTPVPILIQDTGFQKKKFMISTDSLAVVSTPGYLDHYKQFITYPVKNDDIVECLYGATRNSATGQLTGGTYVVFQASISGNGVTTLSVPVQSDIWYVVTLTSAQLASAGHVFFANIPNPQQYVVENFMLDYGTGLTGPGDRSLALTDGTNVWVTVTSLGSPVNRIWGQGNTALPTAPTTLTTPNTVGVPFYFAYTGGTTDYTGGSITVGVELRRIT